MTVALHLVSESLFAVSLAAITLISSGLLSLLLWRWQCERNVLARIIASTHGNHDVLLAIQHVRHRRPALWRGKINSADLFAGRFVISAQHRSTRVLGRCGHLSFTSNHQRLSHQRADVVGFLAGPWNVKPLQCRMIPD